jgi:hypothetical protein
MVEPDRPQKTIKRTRFAYWMKKATDRHLESLILIAFPLQKWLCERAVMLRLFSNKFVFNTFIPTLPAL